MKDSGMRCWRGDWQKDRRVSESAARCPRLTCPVVSIRRQVMPLTTRMRYRSENGRSCIDLKVRHSRQLFDNRDPAPFYERDLDDDAVTYLLDAAQEIP